MPFGTFRKYWNILERTKTLQSLKDSKDLLNLSRKDQLEKGTGIFGAWNSKSVEYLSKT